MAAPSECQLYIIQSEEGPVKIGISSDPTKRISRLSATSGRAIVRTFVSPVVPLCDKMEQALHEQFRQQRTVWELFDVQFDEAVRAAHHLGAMAFPLYWKRSQEYMQGVLCRDRMRKFSMQNRTQAEWDAFLDGMGAEGQSLIRLADQVDSSVIVDGIEKIGQQLGDLMAGGHPVPPQSAFDELDRIRVELDQDMIEAWLK